MTKVQVIGLPGSGKTSVITKFVKEVTCVSVLDIRSFSGLGRERRFLKALLDSNRDTIGESACGVSLPGSIVIMFEVPIQTVYRNCLERDGCLDEDYLSLIQTQMVKPDLVCRTPEELFEALKTVFRGA